MIPFFNGSIPWRIRSISQWFHFLTECFNFLGDVRNSYNSAAIGKNAFQVNVATFVDRKNYYTANFYYLTGKLSGSPTPIPTLNRNLNFQSDVSVFGANLEYRFGHLFAKAGLWYGPICQWVWGT